MMLMRGTYPSLGPGIQDADGAGMVARSARGEGLVGADDLLAEGHERDRDELEVRDAERDPDDGDAEGEAGGDVAEGKPRAREYQFSITLQGRCGSA